jgi:hypothetical protein
MSSALILVIRNLIVDLVARNYAAIVADGRGGRLTESEIGSAIAQYGRTLTVPPEKALLSVDEYPQENAPGQSWIDVPLWTEEEGRSDLTLSVIATKRGETYELRIQDLHVL